MPVYDSLGIFVGYVLYVQKETPAVDSGVRPTYEFLEDIREFVFDNEDLFTDELTHQLRTFCYLCVVNGADAFNNTRYFIPGDDIAYVTTGTVFLALPEPLLLSSEAE